jgi:hypothetical protein
VLALGYGARAVAASLTIHRAAEGRKNFAVLALSDCKLLQTLPHYAEMRFRDWDFAKLQTWMCKL